MLILVEGVCGEFGELGGIFIGRGKPHRLGCLRAFVVK